MEFYGTISKVLPLEQGTSAKGTNWKKQQFVVVDESKDYQETAVFTLFGDKIDALKHFKEGQQVCVAFNIKANEFKGRWFTELQAWKINFGKRVGDAPKLNGDMAEQFNQSQSRDLEDGLNLPF